MDISLIANFVNALGKSLISVCDSSGLKVSFDKSLVSAVLQPENCRIAGIIGFVAENIKGSVTLLADEKAFSSVVSAMSGGMIEPALGDPLSGSVIGELSNMVCGQAFLSMPERCGVTPPQIMVGEDIKNVPSTKEGTKSISMPFSVDGGRIWIILSLG